MPEQNLVCFSNDGKWVSCLNNSYREDFLFLQISNLLSLRFSPQSSVHFSVITVCLCVQRYQVFCFLVHTLNCLRGEEGILMPLGAKKEKMSPSMSHFVTLKFVSL